MARGDHFPFLWPIAVTIMLAAIPAALVIGARVETARFGEPQQRARECILAAEVVRLTLKDLEVQRERYGLPPRRTGADPKLRGVSREGMEALLPRYVPASLRYFLPLPGPIDCSAEFKRHRVPQLGQDIPDRYFARVELSRVVFSRDGSRAFLARGIWCGNLCGSGVDMIWRFERGRWMLESSRGTWIA